MRDLKHNLFPVVAVKTAALAADGTLTGEIIDRAGYESVMFALQSATITTGTFTPKLYHGEEADLSDAAEVPDTLLHGTEAQAAFGATEDDTVKSLGYFGLKRYVRLDVVGTDTAVGTMSAVAVKGDARYNTALMP